MATTKPMNLVDFMSAIVDEYGFLDVSSASVQVEVRNRDCEYLGMIGEVGFDQHTRKVILYTTKYDENAQGEAAERP